MTMIPRSFSDFVRETLCSFPLATVFLARNIRYSRYNYVLGEAGRWVEECMYGSLQWVDSLKQRIRAAKLYLKADHKLRVSEESPCTDHCVRFALPSDDAHFKSACNHDHSMQCDRCLDYKKV